MEDYSQEDWALAQAALNAINPVANLEVFADGSGRFMYYDEEIAVFSKLEMGVVAQGILDQAR